MIWPLSFCTEIEINDGMEELARQVASLEVADTLRSSKRLALPDACMVIEFETLTSELMGRKKVLGSSKKLRLRRIKAFYGTPPTVIAKLVSEDFIRSQTRTTIASQSHCDPALSVDYRRISYFTVEIKEYRRNLLLPKDFIITEGS